MNQQLKNMTSFMLELAAEEFGNHGCNDIDSSFWEEMTLEERKEFVKKYHEFNGDPQDFDEDFLELPDFAVMGFLAAIISGEYDYEKL